MKLEIPQPIKVELTIAELKALYKFIGSTSMQSRMDDFGMSRSESLALGEMFSEISDALRELELQ